ncbi:MAG: hypothetical protein GX173_01590 [Ruminococcaceae bacterium]|nr:hypothetical protein [Oscillospiraceae bacterium]
MLNILATSTTITIDIMNLLLGLLALVGIVFGIYLIIVLARLAGTMKRINKLVEKIDEPVSQTVGQLPDLLKKVDGVMDHVSVMTDSAKESVPAVLGDVQTITGTARSGVEAVGGAVKSVGAGLASFFRSGGKGTRDAHFNVSSLVDIVTQVMSVVSLFSANRAKKKGRDKRRK